MASNLIAMAATLMGIDSSGDEHLPFGLVPKSDDLQPNSDDFHPNNNVLHLNRNGPHPNSNDLLPNIHALPSQ